ncbi:MAG: hypothetical protein UZ22_OP11002001035 [Microgenomates bacterium OLB23]|nr:MAG: hypothetical protein UZ22_OP11002001035 [Microgenomates bacterium OLB23]
MRYPLLISNPTNILHLTGISIESRDGWALAIEDEIFFFTDARYSDVLNSTKKPNITTQEISATHPLSVRIQKILALKNHNELYYEADNLTVNEMKLLRKKVGCKTEAYGRRSSQAASN